MKKINTFFDAAQFLEIEISETRSYVMNKSVTIENYMSMFLSEILNIKNYSTTKSFGNTGSALSFNHKLNLFSELGYVAKEQKIKLIKFAEIRNQFAHNYNCVTFSDSFKDEIINCLKIYYPILKTKNIKEDNFKLAFELLFEDIKKIFENLKSEIYNVKINEFLMEVQREILQATLHNLSNYPNDFNMVLYNKITSEVVSLIAKKHNIDQEKFRKDIILNIGKHLK